MLVQHGGESTPYLIPAPVERVATSTVQSTSKSTELMRDGTGMAHWCLVLNIFRSRLTQTYFKEGGSTQNWIQMRP